MMRLIIAVVDGVTRELAVSAPAESGRGRHRAGLAGVVPGLDDETQEFSAEAPDSEGPDTPGR